MKLPTSKELGSVRYHQQRLHGTGRAPSAVTFESPQPGVFSRKELGSILYHQQRLQSTGRGSSVAIIGESAVVTLNLGGGVTAVASQKSPPS